MKKVLSILAILTFSLSIFAQGVRPISRNTKDFTDMLREAIGKETGQRAAAIKFLPVSCDDSYFSLDQGKRIRSNIEKSATMKSLFDYDPADSSALVIQVCAETLAQGLTDIGFGGGGGGTDTNDFATGVLVTGTTTKTLTISMSDGSSFFTTFTDLDTQLTDAQIGAMGYIKTDTDTQLTEAEVDAFVANNGYLTAELDANPANELETSTCPEGFVSVSDGLGGFTCEEQEEECTTEVTATAHGITYVEYTPIWYTGGAYVDNLAVGTDTFPPVGLLKSVVDANTLELVRCGFEETTYSDGYYYATSSGVSITPTQNNETPIFIAHDGIASVNLDHVYGSSGGNTDIVTRTKTIDSLSQESYIFCDSVFVNGVFDFVYCDTLFDNCISLSDTYIVDAAKVLTSTAAFLNVKMNGDEVVWNELNSATSTGPSQISFTNTSSANSKSKMDIGILSMEVQGVSGTGMAATIGLSKQDYSTSRFTADYEFYFGVGGNLTQIRVKGNLISIPPTTYAIGDVFEIEITETDVIFRKNSNVLITVSEDNQLLPCLTVKEHLSLIALQLKEARNQSISLIHSEFSEVVTQTKSQEIITVPSTLTGTVMSVTYSSPSILYSSGGIGFEASVDVIRAGTTISNIAPIDVGVSGSFFASSTDSFEVQEGDIIRVSVDQLSSNVVSGLTATINFTK